MLFILQDKTESDAMAIEIEELRYEIENSNTHAYIIAKSSFFNKFHRDIDLTDAIPIGTIEFVQSYFRHVHNISNMNPIEIPKVLRLPKFLQRDYQICKADDIPKDVFKFVKNVSVLKQPTIIGNTDNLPKDFLRPDINITIAGDTFCEPGYLYQVSDILDIKSEYRVIVMDNKIMGIQFYDGYCTIMPNEKDIQKIQEMILRYAQCKDCPEAYGMDIAIINKGGKRELSLIEIGPFVAMGSYGCRGPFLPQLYAKGIKWYLRHNTEVELS